MFEKKKSMIERELSEIISDAEEGAALAENEKESEKDLRFHARDRFLRIRTKAKAVQEDLAEIRAAIKKL